MPDSRKNPGCHATVEPPFFGTKRRRAAGARPSGKLSKAFVRLRELLATHKDLAKKLEELEKKYDAQFKVVFDAIRELMRKPAVHSPRGLPPVPIIKGFSAKKV